MSEDRWNTVGIIGQPARYTVYTTKLKTPKEEAGLILGHAVHYSK
jgi:hypothetical protein